MYRQTQPRQKPSTPKKRLVITIAVLSVAAFTIFILERTNTTHFLHKRKAVSSTTSQPSSNTDKGTKGTKSPGSTDTTTPTPSQPSSSTTTPKEGDTSSMPAPNAVLVAPYGNFVSNHSPGKNNSPTTETSVCVTTPGARCSITFTSAADSTVVKTLAAGTADGEGAVYWNNWDVKAAGFTSGTWYIQAVATLGSQTKTTTDRIPLEIQL